MPKVNREDILRDSHYFCDEDPKVEVLLLKNNSMTVAVI
jgi:hypothetical protein